MTPCGTCFQAPDPPGIRLQTSPVLHNPIRRRSQRGMAARTLRNSGRTSLSKHARLVPFGLSRWSLRRVLARARALARSRDSETPRGGGRNDNSQPEAPLGAAHELRSKIKRRRAKPRRRRAGWRIENYVINKGRAQSRHHPLATRTTPPRSRCLSLCACWATQEDLYGYYRVPWPSPEQKGSRRCSPISAVPTRVGISRIGPPEFRRNRLVAVRIRPKFGRVHPNIGRYQPRSR